ncbi:MAG: NAD(P)-dependent oxidoreductase [Eubacteriales bacterium]|nr:NAD(P)-dependent oxidoreductase [Eubacteriales bacterium]
MNVIITGASSFIGRKMAGRLEANGNKVICLRHSFNELSDREMDELKASLDGKTTVLHFAWAGVGSAGRSDATIQDFNVKMSEETLRTAIELGAERFIFAGSQAEYGRPESGIIFQSEENVCNPVSEYGRAKLEFGELGAKICEKYNLDRDNKHKIKFIHTRIFSVYGKGDHETSLVNTCIKNFVENKDMDFGEALQDWNYMHIEDAVKALVLLCTYEFDKADPMIINIAGSEIHPLRWYIEEIYRICNSKSRKNFAVLPDRAEGNTSLRPDISKLKALGFKEERSFEEGIRELRDDILKDRAIGKENE